MSELSKFIKNIADSHKAPVGYFENFVSSYHAFHKRQNTRREICKVCTILAIFVVACSSVSYIKYRDSAIRKELSTLSLNHNKVVIFEGDVVEANNFIKEHVKQQTQSVNLKDYFNGDDVWGVYVPGDEHYRFYYQCLGKGRYTVFILN